VVFGILKATLGVRDRRLVEAVVLY
jgi:hypothetical protein